MGSAEQAISWLSSKLHPGRDQSSQKDGTTDCVIKVQAFPGSDVIPADEKRDEFPVLVRVKAAAAAAAATATAKATSGFHVDVVAVLDISGSMKGDKLGELKDAMKAVINKLSADDRLSIVSFENKTHLLTKLTYMSEKGKGDAETTVEELVASSKTNMGPALQEGAKILGDRKAEEKTTRIGCIMFLSDGKDDGIYTAKISKDFPAYTFGLGADHDSKALKYIADQTHGTYSFVNKDTRKITGAIELFVAGLTSIAAKSIKITLTANEGTTISSIKSGGYVPTVRDDRCSEIHIPDIYAGEVKNFIVYLKVTAEEAGKANLMTSFLGQMPCLDPKKLIMTVGGEYEIVSGSIRSLASREVSVLRPRRGWWLREVASPEVAAVLTRIDLEKRISDMVNQELGDPSQPTTDGNPSKLITGDQLKERWDEIKGPLNGKTTPGGTISQLNNDVDEMQRRLDSAVDDVGKKSAWAYILSWLSCNKWQRATTKDEPSDTSAFQGGDDGNADRRSPNCCWPPSALHLIVVVVALLFFLAAVIGYYSGGHGYGFGFGLKPAAAPGKATAIDLSSHPAWPEMEQDLQAITRRTEDVQITSYFQEASVEDMNLQMDRYLYMAIVHATVLRRRSMGSSISDKSAVRRDAESYLRIMFTRMKNVEIPSFQGSSAEFITYEMNRYLYSTIVQSSVLRGSYTSGTQDGAIDDLPGGGRMINTPTPITDVTTTTTGAFIDDSVLITSATTSAAATITSETITVLEEQKETLVVRVTELEQSRETLMVRITEMEMVLRERETLVVSLRSELALQRESCVQREAMAQVQLRTCAQTVDMWKAKVIAMGGRVDDEDHKY